MDLWTWKVLKTNIALHPRSIVGRLYFLKRCKGGRGLLGVEECVLAETKRMIEYIRTKGEPMLKEVRMENILSEEETKEEYQKRMQDNK